MKKPILLLGALICVFLIVWLPLKKTLHSFENENEQEEYENEEEKEAGVDKQMFSWFTARAYPDPYYLNDKYMRAWQQAEAIRNKYAYRKTRVESGMWNSIGPNSGIGGRILSIAIDPTNSNKLFAGSASGGIWKSTNGGSSWSQVPTGLPVLGVTSIIINPTNSNVIYAGTGEVYRIDSTSGTPNPGNAGFAVWKARGTYGIGILKSTDGGTTWAQVLNHSTSQLFGIQSLRFDPSDPNTVYACATDGLYRSTDAGVNWTKILNLTYISDVVISGTNIVAAVGNFGNTIKGIYKSTNGGTSWTQITSGLPSSFQGFIRFGYLPSDASTIIASIGICETPSGTNELYKSTNFGTSWTVLSSSNHTKWQYWCAHDVAINPFATDSLAFGGVNAYKYRISTATKSSAFSVHDDIHNIEFDPLKRGTLYVCGDGGIYKSTNGGTSFSAINTGLGATQFYATIGVSPTNANVVVGGLQDNGVYITTNGGSSWSKYTGNYGDGASCIMNGSYINTSGDARNFWFSDDGGNTVTNTLGYLASGAPTTTHDSRTAFVAPIAFCQSNPLVVYVGTDNLHKSTDGGSSWSNNVSYSGNTSPSSWIEAVHKPAIALAVSPTNSNKVFASTSNFAQYDNDVDNLHVNGTPNVLRTTNGSTPFTSIKNSLPDRFVMDFAVSPTNDDSVFVVLGGFGTAHVYVTGNAGASPATNVTWTSVGVGLPDAPFNAILIDPVDPRIIYAGGDMGMYASPDRGATWYDFNNGFSDDIAMVMDIQPSADGQLIVASHGEGVFKGPRFSNPLPVTLTSFTGEAATNSNKLTWNIAQELNVSHYEVERSTDGTNFQKIATIKATNRSTYKYEDVLSGNGSYYYRLKIVDNDASYKYSGVIYLKRISKTVVQVLSNPFADAIKIQLSIMQNSKGQINLYDASGKLLRSERLTLVPGQSVYTLNDLSTLPSGTYFMEAIINDQRWKQKLLKN